ncbi:hypothetical protein EJ571_17590 [Mycobacteroides franklinii]|uniref:Uncharacterized protein n=1 Tax=Mycobacteroides franklinii TaxID=948102 RepID=A0A4R5P9I8_9MYCO|nr:hypothetical protein [Mycobacteroides franklinii]TDH20576.1 hypothetical protein EJ571_17590 [Mycobacteroides franklinii]
MTPSTRPAPPANISVPALAPANWFGQGLHGRGNAEGFLHAPNGGCTCTPGHHDEWCYLSESVALQQQFFDHYLKCRDNSWPDALRVVMHVPHPDGGHRTGRVQQSGVRVGPDQRYRRVVAE